MNERNLRDIPSDNFNNSLCSIAAAIGGSAVLSTGVGIFSADKSANAVEQGEQTAASVQQNMYNQTAANLAPYNQAGQSAAKTLEGYPGFNFQPTMANLESTPGYQFALNQGLMSTQNSAAARGLGVSGASYKGAQNYAEGLASTTYQNQFNNALSTYGANIGKYQNLANLGENAAAMTGQAATATGQGIGQTAVGSANAQAQGYLGAGNAINGGISSALQGYQLNQFLNPSAGSVYSDTGVGSPSYDENMDWAATGFSS